MTASAGGLLAANDYAACAQGELPVDLFNAVPSGPLHGGADELVANVAFREFGLVHAVVIGEMARPIGECCGSRPLLCTTHSSQAVTACGLCERIWKKTATRCLLLARCAVTA